MAPNKLPRPLARKADTGTTGQAEPENKRYKAGRVHSAKSDLTDGSCHSGLAQHMVAKSDTSIQFADPFSPFYKTGHQHDEHDGDPIIIEPPIRFENLADLPSISSTLPTCIDAMTVNVALTGYALIYKGKEGKQDSGPAASERSRLKALLECPNPEQPFLVLREMWHKEYETFGAWATEVVRDNTGEIVAFYHIPYNTLRLTTKDRNPTAITQYRWVDNELKKYVFRKRFRRWVQRANSVELLYFKEFGDPRPIDSRTGKVAAAGTEVKYLANELLVFGQFAPGQIYPLPRHMSVIPSIMGNREAELTNYHFFKDNAIPAMVLLISGGYLTKETTDNLKQAFKNNRGRKSMNKCLIIEAQVDEETRDLAETTPENPKLEFKSLSQDRQQDALFLEYIKLNANNIRSAYRIPPIFVGLTEDYTRATATASMEMGESQVFGPERMKFDAVMNSTLLQSQGKPPRFWEFRSNRAKAVGATAITEALLRLEKIGAITPNTGIKLANDMLDLDIEVIAEDWGDMPFEFSKILMANGNMNLKGEFLEKSLKQTEKPAAPAAPAAKK